MGYPPVIAPIVIEKDIFAAVGNKYKLYRHLIDTDDMLWGGVHTAAVLAQRCLQGFVVKAGKELDETEKLLKEELDRLYKNVLAKYTYDMAWKLFQDGTAVYALDKQAGVQKLHYLPMPYLTCVETEDQIAKLEYLKGLGVPKKIWGKGLNKVRMQEVRPYLETTQIMKRGVFVLNELNAQFQQTWLAEDCAVFDWGRTEVVTDLLGRYTLNVWNKSPLIALRAKILWKHALIIGDMQYRRKYYPREHHKLKSELFDPSLFDGETYDDRMTAAQAAAKAYLEKYGASIAVTDEERRLQPDQGYITFDDVEIAIVESKVPYTSPNDLLDQIDKSIPAVTGVPKSAITGAPAGRASFASEAQIGSYLAIKAEFVAEQLSNILIWIAKEHIRDKSTNGIDEFKEHKFEDHFDKIGFKLTQILERHQLIRDAAILAELPLTDDEIRDYLDREPLSDDERKEVERRRRAMGRKHTESTAEASQTARRQKKKKRPPETSESTEERQITH